MQSDLWFLELLHLKHPLFPSARLSALSPSLFYHRTLPFLLRSHIAPFGKFLLPLLYPWCAVMISEHFLALLPGQKLWQAICPFTLVFCTGPQSSGGSVIVQKHVNISKECCWMGHTLLMCIALYSERVASTFVCPG